VTIDTKGRVTAASSLNIADIKSSISGGWFAATGACAANQTLGYLSASDNVTCQSLSLPSPLTGTSETLTSQLVTPIIYGSTSNSGTLTLDGTSAATPGYVLLNTSGGNVGIGTATPASTLEIRQDAASNVAQLELNNQTTSNFGYGPALVFEGNNGATRNMTTLSSFWDGGSSSNTNFSLTTLSYSQAFYVHMEGSVIVGGGNPVSGGGLVIWPQTITGKTPTYLAVVPPSITTAPASVEQIDINFNLARNVQFATGAVTTERAFIVKPPNYKFVGASTLTTAVTMDIVGPPSAGTNATITSDYGLNIESGAVAPAGTVTAAYGLGVNAPTGATSNYAATFNGGNVGINTTSPSFALSIGDGSANDGAIMAQGYGTIGTSGQTLGISGPATRMFWYPKKSAFRAGGIDTLNGNDPSGTFWNDANIGNYSAAFGNDTEASGVNSFAVGQYSRALGTQSVALGEGSWASSPQSVAIGFFSSANGSNATAIGNHAKTWGTVSTAIGPSTFCAGNYSFCFGPTQTGLQAANTGGHFSMAIGLGSPTGQSPTITGTSSMGIFMGDQGGVTVSASNVMTIMGGSVGIGIAMPLYTLDVNGNVRATGDVSSWSDIRAKKNIVQIPDALQKITQLRGVTFDWRQDEFPDKKFKLGRDMGVIAQEVEKVFPEAVQTAPDSFKSVAYPKLVAPLIEAVKELYTKIQAQDQSVDQLLAQVDASNTELESQARTIQSLKTDSGFAK